MTDLARKLTPQETFEKNIVDEMRAKIGSCLPDEVLTELMKRAVNETFFKDEMALDQWGRLTKSGPSWFVREVAKIIEPRLKEQVVKFVEEHGAELDKAIAQFLNDNKLLLVFAEVIYGKVTDAAERFAYPLAEALKR